MSTRVVTAEQSGRVLATSVVSFHQIATHAAHAFEHEWPSPASELVPPAPHPDSLPSRAESLLHRYGREIPDQAADNWPVDMRYVERVPWSGGVSAPRNRLWLRSIGYPDIPGADPAALAFATDLPMFEPVFFPTGMAWSEAIAGQTVLGSSLDHTIWFHRPARLDDWLLLELFAPVAHASRAFIRGELRTPSGRLAASVAQEVVFVDPRSSRGSP